MNLSVKAKLFTGFSVILVLLIATAFILTQKLSETNDRLSAIVNLSSKKISLSQQILVGVLEEGRHEKNIILEKDPVKIQQYNNKIEAALQSIDSKTAELQLIVDGQGKLILNDFVRSWAAFQPRLDEIISLAYKNEDEKAFKISVGEGLQARDEALNILNRLVQKNEAAMGEDKVRSDESYRSALTMIIVLILVSLAISVTLGSWIIQAIGKRISFISKEAEKIASREFTEADMPLDRKDELSPVFNSLAAINKSFREITQYANTVASGNYAVDFSPRSDKDLLGGALKKMTVSLRETTAENQKHTWLVNGQNQLNEISRGDQQPEKLAANIIGFLCRYIKADIGAIYLLDENNKLLLSGKYAFDSSAVKEQFSLGEGVIGEVAASRKPIFLRGVSEENIRVVSAAVHAKPKSVYIVPFVIQDETLGVIELGHLTDFSETEIEFIHSSMESIAISISSANSRKRIQQLLEETQVQSEELLSQQEELKQVNEELEEQAQNLKQQQEELQQTNEELEEQTQALEAKNREVEQSKADIEQKTKQLEVSSKYKSEFLANMSHELRTPLNSLLILSKDLADNKTKNLTTEQVESAEIINKSGHDLLLLINEVLDLSKIEAGKMTLNIEEVSLREFINGIYREFKHHAETKSLKLSLDMADNLPAMLLTDEQRVTQVLKNLLSNAIKFTEEGEITIAVRRHDEGRLAISVTDTGIGIPQAKQMAIFEAFQQADGGTARRYGGTGLGLSISRELAKLLHGRITLSSKPGEGSVFTLIIPVEIRETNPQENNVRHTPPAPPKPFRKSGEYLNYPGIDDDRAQISPGDKILLIIEDDLNFAAILRNQARSKGFKCLAATTGEDGLLLTEKFKPHAILLDIDLPGMNGHQVLAELKANPSLRHIPVHMVSINERSIVPIKEGAVEYLTKPVNKKQLEDAFTRIENFIERKMRNLLIIEDDANSRTAIRKLIGNGDVKSFEAATGEEALALFAKHHIDCIVLDIGLPDISGFDLIHKLAEVKDGNVPPVIVYTGRDLTKEENEELQKYAQTIIIKGAISEERLLDETALFLHRTIDNLPESKQRIITSLYDREQIFHSKKILLVDDDMRNVFALSKVLTERGMEVIKAENGLIALSELNKHKGIDLVLMDIMMPGMDGYEAMQKIRLQPQFRNLPVIALTAKAMKEDKQKCIDAGANDYITKPVDVERLLSLMRVWLSK